MKVIETVKKTISPDNNVVVLKSYDVEGTERISGKMLWPYVFDAKFERQRYSKLYFDLDNGQVLGKPTELKPWEKVCDLDLVENLL